jgi:hypothetical protein
MPIRYVKINGKQHVVREEKMNTILTSVVLSLAHFDTESFKRCVLYMKILTRYRFCERNYKKRNFLIKYNYLTFNNRSKRTILIINFVECSALSFTKPQNRNEGADVLVMSRI